MARVVSADEAVRVLRDGMTVMIGGFMGVGTPETLVDAVVARGIKGLTLIANDTALPGRGSGKLVDAGAIAKLIASHIGLNPTTQRYMVEGRFEVELVPQGTLAERIRAGGAGLGGFLTPTGVGTVVQEGKQVLTLDEKTYLLERPLKADVALIKAHKADEVGNLIYRRAARNFNPLMAMAADVVIAEVSEILPIGAIDPDYVVTPGLFVDYLVVAG